MDQRLLKKLVCHSAGMQAMCQELAPCVKTGSPLLFGGKPGSGMGFSVGAIHAVSRQGKLLRKPCFELDDAAFSEQLFGNAEHGGWLEEYHQGTIFFKHITETSLAVQQILGKIIEINRLTGA
jgi:DNA-binding NtrC family response regulator